MLVPLALLLVAGGHPLGGKNGAPPGLVLVPGGRTQIGIEPKELVRLLEGDPNSQNYAGSLSAETPRHERTIDSFYLMATEVTNEQYLAFVTATHCRPPENWGEAAIRAALEEVYKEDEARKKDAVAQKRSPPPTATFDRSQWWRAHWSTSAWAVPPGDERLPVVHVDFEEARAYARWAGLRLPTEFEFQRAVRGDTTRLYPWGNDWDDEKYAATSALKKKGSLFQVGSFPAGASRQGLFDLAGNAWEWTSSAYAPFPGYERRVFEFGYGTQKRNVNALADWNDAQRVVVGGSFQTGPLMARGTVRRAAQPQQSTDALGFRCAASSHPGFDIATFVLDLELTPNIRPRDARGMIAYAPEACIAVVAWDTAEPAQTGTAPPANYARIARHRFVVFTPVKALPVPDPTLLDKLSQDSGPVAFGMLSISERSVDPDLAPGNYLVSYRAKGVRPFGAAHAASSGAGSGAGDGAGDGAQSGGAPLEEQLHFDVTQDQLILTTLAGKPVRALPTKLEWINVREHRVQIDDDVPASGTEAVDTARGSTLRFDPCLIAHGTQKGFAFELALRFEAGVLDANWMR